MECNQLQGSQRSAFFLFNRNVQLQQPLFWWRAEDFVTATTWPAVDSSGTFAVFSVEHYHDTQKHLFHKWNFNNEQCQKSELKIKRESTHWTKVFMTDD